MLKQTFVNTISLPYMEIFLKEKLGFKESYTNLKEYEKKGYRSIKSFKRYIFGQDVHIFLRVGKSRVKRSIAIHCDETVNGEHKTSKLNNKTIEWLKTNLEKFALFMQESKNR